MLANVSPDGRVLNVSGGTAVRRTPMATAASAATGFRAGVRVWRLAFFVRRVAELRQCPLGRRVVSKGDFSYEADLPDIA